MCLGNFGNNWEWILILILIFCFCNKNKSLIGGCNSCNECH